MLCGCIMWGCAGQAACCVAVRADRWHNGPQWGGKEKPAVGVNSQTVVTLLCIHTLCIAYAFALGCVALSLCLLFCLSCCDDFMFLWVTDHWLDLSLRAESSGALGRSAFWSADGWVDTYGMKPVVWIISPFFSCFIDLQCYESK